MTDRVFALTVFLDEPIRDDDAQPLIDAIRQLRGVADVRTHVDSVANAWARQAARRDLEAKLWKALQDEAQS